MMPEIIEFLKTVQKNVKKILKLLRMYSKLREKPGENIYLIQTRLDEIEKVVSQMPGGFDKESIKSWLTQERATLDNMKEEFRLAFGQKLKRLLSVQGIKLRGQYPILRIGLFTLKVDFQFGKADLFFGPEVEKIISGIRLHPEIVYDKIDCFNIKLKKMKFDPEECMEHLFQAYKQRLERVDKKPGEKLNIIGVLYEYVMLKQSKKFIGDPQKRYFQEYSRIQLSYMLYKLRQAELSARGMRLHVATFDATTDKQRSLWIPENEEGDGTHYSHISFKID